MADDANRAARGYNAVLALGLLRFPEAYHAPWGGLEAPLQRAWTEKAASVDHEPERWLRSDDPATVAFALAVLGADRTSAHLAVVRPEIAAIIARSLLRLEQRAICECGHARAEHGDNGASDCEVLLPDGEHERFCGCRRYREPGSYAGARSPAPASPVALGLFADWVSDG